MSGLPPDFCRGIGKRPDGNRSGLGQGCEPLGADSQGEPEDSKGGLKTSGRLSRPLVREQPAVGQQARPYDGKGRARTVSHGSYGYTIKMKGRRVSETERMPGIRHPCFRAEE